MSEHDGNSYGNLGSNDEDRVLNDRSIVIWNAHSYVLIIIKLWWQKEVIVEP